MLDYRNREKYPETPYSCTFYVHNGAQSHPEKLYETLLFSALRLPSPATPIILDRNNLSVIVPGSTVDDGCHFLLQPVLQRA